jgi:hypothetical protein
VSSAPGFLRVGLGRIVPHWIIRILVMKKLAVQPTGPLHWIQSRDDAKITAAFGSRAEWDSIPAWETAIPAPGDARPLAHGFDDELPDARLGLEQAQSAAAFRGGRCLAGSLTPGHLHTPITWRCAFGHEFTASAYLVLRAGHWCPDCSAPPWNYDEVAVVNPYFAQVWPNPAP